ncbi:hypothetical protein vseg_002469 [Gypsophila vaccaria]
MWVEWVKNSSFRTKCSPFSDHHNFHPHTTSFSPWTTPFSPRTASFSPVKDIDFLLTNSPNHPSSPLHKHAFFSARPEPARKFSSLKDAHAPATEPENNPTRKHPPSIFHRVWAWIGSGLCRANRPARSAALPPPPPDSSEKVVVYYTSLRVVRRTYEDCMAVRSILRAYRVQMDERDLSMDAAYREELEKVSGSKREKAVKNLPRVYINGKYVGGLHEVKQLQEAGVLVRMLRDVPPSEGGRVCRVCGGCRYVVCECCDGSHKVYVDKLEGFRTCHVCNVNGLVRCTFCVSGVV